MTRSSVATACILAFVTAFSSCSFNYAEGDGEGKTLPEMVMIDAAAKRYEDSRVRIEFRARALEVYDADKVWAAEGVSFTEYAGSGEQGVRAEGSAGVLVIDDRAEIYTLGREASFRMIDDDLFLAAPDIRWSRKDNALAGPEDGVVEVRERDGTVIRGTGFFADTLRRTYRFSGRISGEFVRDPSDADGLGGGE